MNNISSMDISLIIRNMMILVSIYILISRKEYVNAMAESNIPTNDMILRCGWETKSLHKISSYDFTFMSNDMIFGNTLSH